MKTFQTLVGVRKPVAEIAATVRNRLSEIAPDLADVSSIAVTHRALDAEGRTVLTNKWRVAPALPGAVRAVIPPESMGWHDHAVWAADLSRCDWRIETFFMPGSILCSGSTRFESAMGGRGTRALFDGQFAIDDEALASLPLALRAAAKGAIEAIVGTLIPRNFRKTITAAEALLERGGPA